MPRKNTSSADYPQAVLREIERLAQNITIARKRRGESQAQWARKLGISQPTMGRIERGDPSVAMASYVMCMWLINQGGGLADLIAPQNDHAALEKEVAKVHPLRKLGQQGRAGLPAAPWNSAPVASQNAAVAERPESAPPATTGRRSERGRSGGEPRERPSGQHRLHDRNPIRVRPTAVRARLFAAHAGRAHVSRQFEVCHGAVTGVVSAPTLQNLPR